MKSVLNLGDIEYLKSLGVWRPLIALLAYCVLFIFLVQIVFGASINVFWEALVLGAFFYFPLLYAVYAISVYCFKSYKMLVLGLCFLALAWLYMAINSQGTLYFSGYLLSYKGKITTIGLIFSFIHPYIFLALFSVFVGVTTSSHLDNKKERKKL